MSYTIVKANNNAIPRKRVAEMDVGQTFIDQAGDLCVRLSSKRHEPWAAGCFYDGAFILLRLDNEDLLEDTEYELVCVTLSIT